MFKNISRRKNLIMRVAANKMKKHASEVKAENEKNMDELNKLQKEIQDIDVSKLSDEEYDALKKKHKKMRELMDNKKEAVDTEEPKKKSMDYGAESCDDKKEASKKVVANPVDKNGTPELGDAPNLEEEMPEPQVGDETVNVKEEETVEKEEAVSTKTEPTVDMKDEQSTVVVVKLKDKLEQLSDEIEEKQTTKKEIEEVLNEAGVTAKLQDKLYKVLSIGRNRTKVGESTLTKAMRTIAKLDTMANKASEMNAYLPADEKECLNEIKAKAEVTADKGLDVLAKIKAGKIADEKNAVLDVYAAVKNVLKEWNNFKDVVAFKEKVGKTIVAVQDEINAGVISSNAMAETFDNYMSMTENEMINISARLIQAVNNDESAGTKIVAMSNPVSAEKKFDEEYEKLLKEEEGLE